MRKPALLINAALMGAIALSGCGGGSIAPPATNSSTGALSETRDRGTSPSDSSSQQADHCSASVHSSSPKASLEREDISGTAKIDCRNSGHVYAQTNAASGNAIVNYGRNAEGQLTYIDTVSTGGNGVGTASVLNGQTSADPLSSQHSIILNADHTKLFAVNAGSGTVSVFTIPNSGDPHLVGTYAAGGVKPTSLTVNGSILYVGHAVANASNNQLFGFTINSDGSLTAIPSAAYAPSAATPIAALSFSPNGHWLAATEPTTGKIDIYPVNSDGTLGTPVVNSSAGAGPFGVLFTDNTHIVVAEAAAEALSSYALSGAGRLSAVSSSVTDQQVATCWISITPNGRLVFASNPGSSDVSSYAIGSEAKLNLLRAVEAENHIATPSTGPIDSAISDDGKFFYQQYSVIGVIGAYEIHHDGRLLSVNGDGTQLPAGTQGIAAF